jgi:hypothetical protein
VAGLGVAAVCAVGVACAAHARQTGYRTHQVQQLRVLVREARRDDSRICQISGPDEAKWREVLLIVAPNRLGCNRPSLLEIAPDSQGEPTGTRR